MSQPFAARLRLHRTGLSRIEVLVLLLIVTVASGLIFAAIGRVRETAALMSCQNNLRQIGLAVDNYVITYNHLPPLVDQGEGAPTGNGIPSAFAHLTPYIEAHPWFYKSSRTAREYTAHSSVEFSYRNKDDTPGILDGGVANQAWRVFIDPADSTAKGLRDIPMTLPDGSTGYYTTGSYAANGLLPWGTGGLADLRRGSANTIMIAERPQVCRTTTGDTVYNLWGVGFYCPNMPAFAALTPSEPPGLGSTDQLAPVSPLPGEGVADRDSLIQYRLGRQDAAPQPADFATPIQLLARGHPCDPRLPGSPHKGGMQVVMADGSVRLFGPETSPWLFWSACVSGGTTENMPGSDR
jgi:prepilin-type processing-associated H-X9-DG protein